MDASEMREMFGDRVVELIGPRLREWNSRQLKGCCPLHPDKTPSFVYHGESFRFKCFGCGETMDVYRYYMHFHGMNFKEAKAEVAKELGVETTKSSNITTGYSKNMNPPAIKKPGFELKSKPGREYACPVLEAESASIELIDYLDTRGITEATIAYFGVTGNSTRMFFNIRDESGKLCNIKARNIGDFEDNSKRGFSQTKNARQALFGMHIIKEFDNLYITEGEIDAMSLFEAGFTNVVSIPAGSSNAGWIETNWEWLSKFTGFVIWGDMDEAGEKFRRETCKRLGEDKCRYVEYDIGSQKQFKDANGILKLKGIKAIQTVLSERVRMYPIEGGIFMSDVPTIDDQDYSQNVPTGIWGIDHVLIDPRLGQTILVSGREGTGKSTLLSQISLNAVAAGWKTMMYSGEMPAHRVKQWLFNQAAQNHRFVTVTELKYGRQSHYPRADMVPYIEKWLNNGFVLFDNSQLSIDDPPKILDIMERFITRYGVKVLIIDNLLTSDFRRYGPSGNENAQETEFLKAVVALAMRMNVLIYVVAHPRKKGAGSSASIDADEIGGSGNKKNLVQTVIFLHRDDEDDTVSYASILKNREFGTKGAVPLIFDPRTKQYVCQQKGAAQPYPWVRQYEARLQECAEKKARDGKLMGGQE